MAYDISQQMPDKHHQISMIQPVKIPIVEKKKVRFSEDQAIMG